MGHTHVKKTENKKTEIKTMDTLYETILMPKPPTVRGHSPQRRKKSKKKNLITSLMKLSLFPGDRMRRDSTVTAVTTLSDSTGSVDSVHSRELARHSYFAVKTYIIFPFNPHWM